jgi:uncharacterized membrane protein
MLDVLQHLFSFVCGQDPAHTWAPGGLELPCCQRCLGLYSGAAVAATLYLWLRPKFTSRFLELNGLFLLLMVPYGFHWLPQGPVLRTLTGSLFGFGVVTYLTVGVEGRPAFAGLLRRGRGARTVAWRSGETAEAVPQSLHRANTPLKRGVNKNTSPRGRADYQMGLCSRPAWGALFATLVFVPLLAALGGRGAAYALSGIALSGALVLAALVAANLGRAVAAVVRGVWRLAGFCRLAPHE